MAPVTVTKPMDHRRCMSLLADLVWLIGSQLTREQAIPFFCATIRTGLPARRAYVVVYRAGTGKLVMYPEGGDYVSNDEQRVCIPLSNGTEFGYLIVEQPGADAGGAFWEIVGSLRAGILCCGEPPAMVTPHG